MISLNVAVNAKNVSLKLNNKYIVSNISFEIPKDVMEPFGISKEILETIYLLLSFKETFFALTATFKV
jgi:hypothetical protein